MWYRVPKWAQPELLLVRRFMLRIVFDLGRIRYWVTPGMRITWGSWYILWCPLTVWVHVDAKPWSSGWCICDYMSVSGIDTLPAMINFSWHHAGHCLYIKVSNRTYSHPLARVVSYSPSIGSDKTSHCIQQIWSTKNSNQQWAVWLAIAWRLSGG